MKSINTRIVLCCLALVMACATGCTAKARAERHVKRGDDYFEKGEFEKAKLEYLNAARKGARDPRAMSRLGDAFIKDGNVEQGVRFLVLARNLDPTNVVVRQSLTSIFAGVNRPDYAREEAIALLKLSPADPLGVVTLAQTASTKEQIADARKQLEPLLTSAPANAAVPYALGILAQNSKDPDGARNLYKKALSIDPKQSRFHLALADLAAATGDLATADNHFKSAVALAPVKSWDRLRYGEYLVKVQRFDDAEKFLEETIEKEPQFLRAINILTEAFLARKKLDRAEASNAKALALAPKAKDTLLNGARIKLGKGDNAGALSELEELSRTYPRDPAVNFNLALAYLANSQPAKAISAADTTIALDPKHIQAQLLRAEVQLSQNDINAALPDLQRIVREYPTLPQPRFLLASAYIQKGSFAEAVPIYTELARGLSRDPRPYYLLGVTYRRLNKPVDAREALNSALAINSDFALAVEELTNLDIEEKKFDSAMARLRPFMQKYTNSPSPLLLVARVYVAQGNTEEAFKTLQKSLEIDPKFYPGQRALVDLYIATGKRDIAITRLSEMVQKDPKDSNSLMQLAQLQEAGKDFKAARASYDALLKLNPNDAMALNNLATIISDQSGETDKAFEYARRARELAPGNAAVADTYGWLLWKKGDYARALPVLQESTPKLTMYPEAVYHLGMALYMSGSDQDARAALESAVKAKSDFVGKDTAVAALATLKIDPATASADTVKSLQKRIKENPNDFVAQLRLAQIYEHQKQWENANQTYQAALQINERSTNVLVRLADLNFRFNNPKRALEFAKQAWSVAPENSLVLPLGEIGYKTGDYKWASAVFAEGRRTQPDDGRVTYYQGLNSYALGDVARARDMFVESTKAPKSPVPLAKEAAALLAFQLDPKSAPDPTATVSAALKTDPKFAPALIVSGMLAEKKNDFAQARTRYEEALASYPGHISAERQLGMLLAEQLASDDKANELLLNVTAEIPGDAPVSKALGKIAYRRGDYKEASRYLKDARVKIENDADLLYHLGMSQYHLNEKQAKEALSEALKLDPKSNLASSAQKALAELR